MPPRNTGGFSRYVNPRAHYAGTPLESDWEKLQRRRAINDAITRQSMAPYQGTEMVSGRAVDDRWGQGIGKIGQAIVGAMGNKDWNEKADSLNEQYDTGRKEAMGKVTEALREQGNSGEYGPQIPKKADHMKAAMGLLDPYLKHGDISRALINSQAYGKQGRSSYHRPQYGESGMLSYDSRTGTPTHTSYSDIEGAENFHPLSGDVGLAGRKSEATTEGDLRAKLEREAQLKADIQQEKNAQAMSDPNSPEFRTAQKEHSVDLGVKGMAEIKTSEGIKKIDWILDQSRKGEFDANFGGYNAAATQYRPGAQDMRKAIDSLQSVLKSAGLDMMRAEGAIGQMTEREWPMVASAIQTVSPLLGEKRAREVLLEIKSFLTRINKNATTIYGDRWSETQFSQPKEVPETPTGGAIDRTDPRARLEALRARKAAQGQ